MHTHRDMMEGLKSPIEMMEIFRKTKLKVYHENMYYGSDNINKNETGLMDLFNFINVADDLQYSGFPEEDTIEILKEITGRKHISKNGVIVYLDGSEKINFCLSEVIPDMRIIIEKIDDLIKRSGLEGVFKFELYNNK